MWLALFVQLVGQVIGVSQTPIVAKEWVQKNIVELLIPAIGQIPYMSSVMPYLLTINVEIWSTILSFCVIWIVGFYILQRVAGQLGIILALGIGMLAILWWTGNLEGFRKQLPFLPAAIFMMRDSSVG